MAENARRRNSKKFVEDLAKATDEVSQVQPLYREELLKTIPDYVPTQGTINATGSGEQKPVLRWKSSDKKGRTSVSDIRVEGTDGLLELEYLEVGKGNIGTYVGFVTLMECKLDQDLHDIRYRCEVILQTVCYMKQLKEKAGCEVPLVVMVGTKKDCFLLPRKVLMPFVEKDIQGYKSASTAAKLNPSILVDMMNTEEIRSVYIHPLDDKFSMSDTAYEIYQLASTGAVDNQIDEAIISKAFDYFTMHVLQEKKFDPRDAVKWFITLILKPDDCYMHPKKAKLVIAGVEVAIDKDTYLSFKTHFGLEKEYTLEEQRKFTAIQDRLIEDETRRRRGDFYTPTVWVDEAHKLLDKELGAGWRGNYMVWDCCCGTMNLTRDYTFGVNNENLFASTLVQGDLDCSAEYNKGSTRFQYDFLNDDVDEFEIIAAKKNAGGVLSVDDFKGTKLYKYAPRLIERLLDGEKLLFLINPPYGTSGEMAAPATGKEKKAGIAVTKVNTLMKLNKMGHSAQNLYAQFMYRVARLNAVFCSISLGVFAPTLFMCSRAFSGLYSDCLRFRFRDGFILQASQFADVKANWAISFTYWGDNGSDVTSLTVYDYVAGNICNLGTKTFAFSPVSVSDWLKVTKSSRLDLVTTFTMSSALGISDGEFQMSENDLGYYLANSTIVESNNQFVMLMPRKLKGHLATFPVLPDNFLRVTANFTARRLVTGPRATWVNCKDEYMIPNVDDARYASFEADSIVYSLFNNASNQSSLRDIDYNGKKWDIKNEFFWLSRDEMISLCQNSNDPENINNDVGRDLRTHADDERYVYKLLSDPDIQSRLSPEAKAVLDAATALLKKSFKHRKVIAQLHPEFHLNTWDMGYYQMNKLIKECGDLELQAEFKQFRELYKALDEKLYPLVYELGFLKGDPWEYKKYIKSGKKAKSDSDT